MNAISKKYETKRQGYIPYKNAVNHERLDDINTLFAQADCGTWRLSTADIVRLHAQEGETASRPCIFSLHEGNNTHNKPIALGLFMPSTWPESESHGTIKIIVNKDYRDRGLEGILLSALVPEAIARGFHSVVTVKTSKEKAGHYINAGFLIPSQKSSSSRMSAYLLPLKPKTKAPRTTR